MFILCIFNRLEEEKKMNAALMEEKALITQACSPKISFEERSRMRKEEIANLKNALDIIRERQ